jgi:hypothetical protein
MSLEGSGRMTSSPRARYSRTRKRKTIATPAMKNQSGRVSIRKYPVSAKAANAIRLHHAHTFTPLLATGGLPDG